MRPAVLLAAVVPLAWALPSTNSPRAQTDAQKVVAAINNIQTNIATVNGSLNKFNKGDLTAITEVLTIQQQTENLGKSIQSATSVAKSIKNLDSTDSGTVAIAVLNFQPQVFSLLDNIKRKKPAFDSAVLGVGSVAPQVEQDLQQQKSYSDAFGKALTAKLAAPYSTLAPGIIKQIDDAFDSAIKLYSKSGGLFALPPLPTFQAFKDALLKAEKGGLGGIPL